MHPLFGRLLPASGFQHRGGVLLLVVTLPDGSPGTVPAAATDVLGSAPAEPGTTTLTVEGIRRLCQMAASLAPAAESRRRGVGRK